MVERILGKDEVMGSIPIAGSIRKVTVETCGPPDLRAGAAVGPGWTWG